jgi:predicted RNase H-like HicB family nuclease
MPKFLIVMEKSGDNYSAYSPDIPGCVATGATPHEAEERINQAIMLHIEGLIEDGLPVPESHSSVTCIAV